MADFSTLIASIEATIKENGVQAITGQVLQDELLLMVNAINQLKQDTLEGYAFYGEPLPNGATRVVTQNTFFLAGAGSYTINGNAVTITDSGISVIVYDCVNDEITTYQLFAYDANPISGSANAVTSGGVKSALDTKADKNGASPDLFAGFAGNLVDTRSAGTPQGPYAFRQSGGDGVDYMVRIKGKTEAFNQLVGDNDTEVIVPSGHQYFAIIGGTASVATSDGSPISVTGGVDIVVDLTLDGLGLTTADQFQSLHPLPYYNYNAGVLKNNAATGIKTRGFNQWDEEAENGGIDGETGENNSSATWSRSKNYIKVLSNTLYYVKKPSPYLYIYQYDVNHNYLGVSNRIDIPSSQTFTTAGNAAYIRLSWGQTTYNHDICINISDASRNGTYEPYWERTLALGLNSIPCHDENNNAVVVNGLDGVGTSQDELIVENGWGKKINKNRVRVDLGDLTWMKSDSGAHLFYSSSLAGRKLNTIDIITAKYAACSFSVGAGYEAESLMPDKSVCVFYNSGQPTNLAIFIKDSAYSDAPSLKAALDGVYLDYPLATPKVLTLDNPIPALIEVDNLGTEKRLPEDTADNPQGGFESDSNYSVSVANLVRLLNS